jgi:choline dehydrogenase-like flavoprotein
VPPIHPVLAAITLPGDGAEHAQWMRGLAHMQVVIALMRDGFDPRSSGGTVALRQDGTPLLDYPLNDHVWDAARRAFATMAQIQFAAGARVVMPVHASRASYRSWSEAQAGIAALPLAPLVAPLFSAHVMGGSALGPDPRRSAVDPSGRYHHLDNLYVLDGSLFPTSIGANPQLSIYAIVAKLATAIAAAL